MGNSILFLLCHLPRPFRKLFRPHLLTSWRGKTTWKNWDTFFEIYLERKRVLDTAKEQNQLKAGASEHGIGHSAHEVFYPSRWYLLPYPIELDSRLRISVHRIVNRPSLSHSRPYLLILLPRTVNPQAGVHHLTWLVYREPASYLRAKSTKMNVTRPFSSDVCYRSEICSSREFNLIEWQSY